MADRVTVHVLARSSDEQAVEGSVGSPSMLSSSSSGWFHGSYDDVMGPLDAARALEAKNLPFIMFSEACREFPGMLAACSGEPGAKLYHADAVTAEGRCSIGVPLLSDGSIDWNIYVDVFIPLFSAMRKVWAESRENGWPLGRTALNSPVEPYEDVTRAINGDIHAALRVRSEVMRAKELRHRVRGLMEENEILRRHLEILRGNHIGASGDPPVEWEGEAFVSVLVGDDDPVVWHAKKVTAVEDVDFGDRSRVTLEFEALPAYRWPYPFSDE